jgi:predicted extracellular nuclease
VILAGDFNWNFSIKKGYMSPFKYKGYKYNNFFVPPDQNLSKFKHVEEKRVSDHDLIFVDVETKVFH